MRVFQVNRAIYCFGGLVRLRSATNFAGAEVVDLNETLRLRKRNLFTWKKRIRVVAYMNRLRVQLFFEPVLFKMKTCY